MSFALLGDELLQISSKNISEKLCKESIGVTRKTKSDIVFSANYTRIFKALSYFSEPIVYFDIYDGMISIYDNSGYKTFIALMQDDM